LSLKRPRSPSEIKKIVNVLGEVRKRKIVDASKPPTNRVVDEKEVAHQQALVEFEKHKQHYETSEYNTMVAFFSSKP
jgi:hypothetical protein